jgi:multidrug resistance efflux pump
MSDTTFNKPDSAGGHGLAVSSPASPLARSPKPEAPAAESPHPSWSLTRTVVVFGVVVATGALVVTGWFWATYRWQHTVIRNANVKGRVYKVGARIDSQVRSVEVQPGQRVVRDQLLIRLVDDHFQAATRQAEAALQAAIKRAEVEKLAIEQERRRLTLEVQRCENVCHALTSEVKAAKSDLAKWQFELARVSALRAASVASLSELDNVTTQRDSAAARAEVAEGNLATAETNGRLAQVQVEGLKVREAGLDVLAAEVELARQGLAVCGADVAATLIRAPADGWVVDRIVEPGGSAKVGEPMMSLWLGAPWIEAWVDEKKLAQIRISSPVDVTLTAFPGRKLRGQVESIGVLADKELQSSPVPSALHSFFADNAMIPVRIAVADEIVRLQPGLSATVGIRDADPVVSAKSQDTPDGFLGTSGLLNDESKTLSRRELKTKTKPN